VGALAVWLAGAVLPAAGTGGCGPPTANAGAANWEEQRLLPAIVRHQEERATRAAAAAGARDDLVPLRLRQRMLEQSGRPDLAVALVAEAQKKAAEVRASQRPLADEEATLQASREYAARTRGGGAPAPRPSS
jgi:hypothetical protein